MADGGRNRFSWGFNIMEFETMGRVLIEATWKTIKMFGMLSEA